MTGATRRHRVLVVAAAAVVCALAAGLAGASALLTTQGPQPIYAAFSLVKQGTLRQQRCGTYRITRGTYTGTSFSPDPRMAGAATYVGTVSALPSGQTGIANGTLTIRNGNRVRMRANGLGRLHEPLDRERHGQRRAVRTERAAAGERDDGLRRRALVRRLPPRPRERRQHRGCLPRGAQLLVSRSRRLPRER